jgi:Ran GTPase-activating protein (RanGAP) involved in mRNA processing and transport
MKDLGSIAGALGNLPSLTHPDLNFNSLCSIDSARKLADALRHFDHLTHLKLAVVFVRVDDDLMEALPDLLESLNHLPSLTHLDLRSNSFPNAAVESIALSLSQSTSIAHLDLSGNRIGDAGAGRLAEMLQKCASLKELDLTGNDFGEETQERLEAAAAAAGVALRS